MNLKTILLAYLLIYAFQPTALAQLYSGSTKEETQIENMVSQLKSGDVIVIGEIHDHPKHHFNQKELLNELWAQGVHFDVGMEFFYDFRKQKYVDQYLYNKISEADFLKQMNWGGDNFDFYRDLVLLPLEVNGWTYAINAPRELTSAVAKDGLENLSPHLKNLLPVDFEIGNNNYFERFKEAVGGDHVPKDKLDNYFAAQSIWDDTMAWMSLSSFEHSKSDVFVIIVGDFHVAFGGGLPDRLKARGAQRVITVSQIDSSGLNKSEKLELLEPDAQWGQRADWIWLSDREESSK
ncbi:MAG: ChaN family lipoprotein [Bdellovibrionales bacterium]|nr:ChaN family lipoprotein [Bdellovibrionales bacterium]